MTVRVPLRLTPKQVRDLDLVAASIGAELQPHHAATAGHKWNRKEAVVHLIENHLSAADAVDVARQEMVEFINEILTPFGGSCRVRGNEVVVSLQDKVKRLSVK